PRPGEPGSRVSNPLGQRLPGGSPSSRSSSSSMTDAAMPEAATRPAKPMKVISAGVSAVLPATVVATVAGIWTVYTPGVVYSTTAPLVKLIEALLPSPTMMRSPAWIDSPDAAGMKSPPMLVDTEPLTCMVPMVSWAIAGAISPARAVASATLPSVFMWNSLTWGASLGRWCLHRRDGNVVDPQVAAGVPGARHREVAELQPLPRAALGNAEFGLAGLPGKTALQRSQPLDLPPRHAADGPVPALLAVQELGAGTQRQAVASRRQQQRLAQVADRGLAADEAEVGRALAARAGRRLEVREHARGAGVAPVEAELAGIPFEAA